MARPDLRRNDEMRKVKITPNYTLYAEGSVLIEMVGLGWVPAWIAIVIVIRELAVTGLRAVAADNGMIIAADRYGKLKTVLQIVALVPLLVHFPLYGMPMQQLGIFILYIALLLTVVSGINYFYRFFRDWAAEQQAGTATPNS